MEVLNSCGTLRRVDNPDERLREARDKGCTIWLLLDPGCRKEALARLYEHEPDAEKTILFLDTALEESSEVSPWLMPLSRDSPMERWISGANPPGWGLYLASDAPFDEMLAHLRGLALPPSEALSAFVARHVNRGLALSPLARTPLDEDAAVAAMRNVYNPGDTHA